MPQDFANQPADSAIFRNVPTKQQGWVDKIEAAAAAEKRYQPWKKIMEGRDVDQSFEGEDIKKVHSDGDAQHTCVAA